MKVHITYELDKPMTPEQVKLIRFFLKQQLLNLDGIEFKPIKVMIHE